VSYHIALAGETHTVAEALSKLYVVEMATCVLGEQSKKKLTQFSYLILPLNIMFKVCQQM
jgi:hypothetical protein